MIEEKGYESDPNEVDLRDFDELRILKERGFYGVIPPVLCRLPGTQPQTAANYTTPFFIANRPYTVLSVTERHETAGSDAGAVTVSVYKVPSGTAPASGTDLLTAGISLKATANTNQTGTVSSDVTVRRLATGDALSLISSGTLTAVTGVTVSVILKAI